MEVGALVWFTSDGGNEICPPLVSSVGLQTRNDKKKETEGCYIWFLGYKGLNLFLYHQNIPPITWPFFLFLSFSFENHMFFHGCTANFNPQPTHQYYSAKPEFYFAKAIYPGFIILIPVYLIHPMLPLPLLFSKFEVFQPLS